MNEEKVYYTPGCVVELRQKLTNKPTMLVKSVDKTSTGIAAPELLGITCEWFNTRQELQSARFSTKDLVHVE